jgi:hypothetical protein
MKVVILRSDLFNVFLLKVVGPAFCVVVSLLLISGYFPGWNLLHASPFLIAAWFGASLAIVEVRGDVLRYRRLFKWTIIPEGDIVSARVVLGVGSMRLKRFLFPWGRLYFVLDANSEPNPFRKAEFPLLRYMRKEPIREAAPESVTRAKLRQVIAAVAGALAGLLHITFSRPVPQERSPNAVIEIVFQIFQLLEKFGVVYIFFVVFTLLAIYQYRRRDAWIYAFLAGAEVPLILLHWLR